MESNPFILTLSSWTDTIPLQNFFRAGHPLEVDAGCGKGRFLAARARSHPETDFLGIDRLLARLHKVEKKITRQGLNNVRLLRIETSYAFSILLPAEAISTVYLFFPDPWPKRRHHRRRLFSEDFLQSVHRALVTGGKIHIATDHLDYFREIQSILTDHPGFSEIETFVTPEDQRTDFETLFLAKNLEIGRCSFQKTGPQPGKA